MEQRNNKRKMSDRLYSFEFILWVKATLGLQITKDALCSVIERQMTEFVIMLNDQEDHLRTSFLPKKILTGDRVKYKNAPRDKEKWQFQSRCTRCCSMFTSILELHTNRRHRSINWQCHHQSEQDSAPVWWIIAKIFIPGNNISCMGPQEADPLALFSLIMNCKLFSILWIDTQKVIEVRNFLMHHPSNTIKAKEMGDAMNKMKTLLEQEMVQETSAMASKDIKQLEQEPLALIKLSKETRKSVVQTLQLKASSIKFDIKAKPSIRKSTEGEVLKNLLQETEDEITKENDFCVDKIQRLEKTNAYLREENQCSQKLYEDECAKRQQLEQKNTQLRRKLSDTDHRLQLKEREFEESNKELKQMKLLYNNELTKRQQLENENAELRKKISDEDEKVTGKLELIGKSAEEIKQITLKRGLKASSEGVAMNNKDSEATASGTVV